MSIFYLIDSMSYNSCYLSISKIYYFIIQLNVTGAVSNSKRNFHVLNFHYNIYSFFRIRLRTLYKLFLNILKSFRSVKFYGWYSFSKSRKVIICFILQWIKSNIVYRLKSSTTLFLVLKKLYCVSVTVL